MKHIAHIFLISSILIILSIVAINYSFNHGGFALTGLEIIEPQMFKDTTRPWVIPEDNRILLEAEKLGKGVFSATIKLTPGNAFVWGEAYYLTRDGWNPIDILSPVKKNWVSENLKIRIKDFEARLPSSEMASEALGIPSYDDGSLIIISFWCENVINDECLCIDDPDCAYWVLSSVKV